MNTDGSNQVQLTDDPSDDRSPSWSPDGSQIVFGSKRDGNFEIYVMNANGDNLSNLTNGIGNQYFASPSWMPVGTPAGTLIEATSWGQVKAQ